MGCCSANVKAGGPDNGPHNVPGIPAQHDTLLHAGKALPKGGYKFTFSVPSIHCGGCISRIERGLLPLQGVASARVNLTLKRLNVVVREPRDIIGVEDTLNHIGFPASSIDSGDENEVEGDKKATSLLKAMAVAGFAAANIMLLSVSVWSGADGPTRDLFHLISAVIAIPVVAYSGQVFFRSALGALKQGHLNMDVPISLAVLLALGMSLFETLTGGANAYFDAAVTLLFFLLIGRYLDQNMRDRARKSVVSLSRLAAKGANHIGEGGKLDYVPLDAIVPDMQLRVFPGDRIPVDGTILRGSSDLDRSLVTGESTLAAAGVGDEIEAGTLNVTGSLDLLVTKTADQSFLSEVMKMLEAAENGRGGFVRIADRMARIYAPAVHLLALAAFIGWLVVSGGDWHRALTIAIAVLIVTCPCALGLAVPVVHVVGATRLFQNGILMRDGSALERIADIDHVVFDKTGTLTMGEAGVSSFSKLGAQARSRIKTLAANSSHPASRAVARLLKDAPDIVLESVSETPGYGIEASVDGKLMRLGRPQWVAEIAGPAADAPVGHGLAFAIIGAEPIWFALEERLRIDALGTISTLEQQNISTEILSGDGAESVRKIAAQLGIDTAGSRETPASKFARINALQAAGSKVLMVGDGINDAPSLAAGHASMAPASASDIGRQAADFVFTRDSLQAVPFAIAIARRAGSLVRGNFALAILYNCIAVPLAMAGYVTPLVAAIAMSASSIVVVANSLRLLGDRNGGTPTHAVVGKEPNWTRFTKVLGVSA